MDLIMGNFSESNVPGMELAELDMYEELLNTPDPDVYDWISGQKTVPANVMNPVIERLISYDYAQCSPVNNDDAKL